MARKRSQTQKKFWRMTCKANHNQPRTSGEGNSSESGIVDMSQTSFQQVTRTGRFTNSNRPRPEYAFRKTIDTRMPSKLPVIRLPRRSSHLSHIFSIEKRRGSVSSFRSVLNLMIGLFIPFRQESWRSLGLPRRLQRRPPDHVRDGDRDDISDRNNQTSGGSSGNCRLARKRRMSFRSLTNRTRGDYCFSRRLCHGISVTFRFRTVSLQETGDST